MAQTDRPADADLSSKPFFAGLVECMPSLQSHLISHPFFLSNSLIDMNSGPIVAMVWEGLDAVKTGRGKDPLFLPNPFFRPFFLSTPKLTSPLPAMLGATNPLSSAPGTIRGDLCLQMGRNVCHGSDSVESANQEIALWFKDEDLITYESAQKAWIYE